jgi:hypothetical protein
MKIPLLMENLVASKHTTRCTCTPTLLSLCGHFETLDCDLGCFHLEKT